MAREFNFARLWWLLSPILAWILVRRRLVQMAIRGKKIDNDVNNRSWKKKSKEAEHAQIIKWDNKIADTQRERKRGQSKDNWICNFYVRRCVSSGANLKKTYRSNCPIFLLLTWWSRLCLLCLWPPPSHREETCLRWHQPGCFHSNCRWGATKTTSDWCDYNEKQEKKKKTKKKRRMSFQWSLRWRSSRQDIYVYIGRRIPPFLISDCIRFFRLI
jgi:hypothetical protein